MRAQAIIPFLAAATLLFAPGASYALDDDAVRDCKTIGLVLTKPDFSRPDSGMLAEALKSKDWGAVRGALLLNFVPPPDLSSRDRARVEQERKSALLIPAAARGDLAGVQRLLRAGARADSEAKADNFMNPLAWAAKCDHPEIVELLIAHGARVNRRASFPLIGTSGNWVDGATPLILASESGATSAVRVLLRHGADVRLRDRIYNGPDGKFEPNVTALEAASDAKIKAMLRRAGARR